jgi:hypothetical protein
MPQKIDLPEGQGYCGKCQQFLAKDKFHRDFKRPSGVARYCKICATEYNRKRLGHNAKVVYDIPVGMSRCNRCEQIKPEGEFTTSTRTKNGRHSWCKPCVNSYMYKEAPDLAKVSKHFGRAHHYYKPATVINSTPEQKAYVAGLFDAEGCIQIGPGRSARIDMTFSNNNECLIAAVEGVLGGLKNRYERDQKKRDGGMQRVSEGRLALSSAAQSEFACEAMLPFLILKKLRCELAVTAFDVHPLLRGDIKKKIEIENERQSEELVDVNIPSEILSVQDVKGFRETDVAYLCGMIDGDGWIGLNEGYVNIHPSAITLTISTARWGFALALYEKYGGTINGVIVSGKYKDGVAYQINFRLDDLAWPVLLDRMKKYLVLKRKHASIILSLLNGQSRLDIKGANKVLRQMTYDARQEKFKYVKQKSDEATVYTLDQYAQKDAHGAGPKGETITLDPRPSPTAEELGIKMYSLSEYATKEAV